MDQNGFTIVDSPSPKRRGHGRFVPLVAALKSLPPGKSIEVAPADGEPLLRFASSLRANLSRHLRVSACVIGARNVVCVTPKPA
jgi:hypothetical protein